MAKANNNEAKKPVVGGVVHLVLARGEHVEAKVERVHAGDKIDLFALIEGHVVVITNSPLDETGKLPDSWHMPEAGEAKAE